MNKAFPDANVEGYADLISELKLPDVDDRHVLAAAIHANATVIVTQNGKDFPIKYLKKFGIQVLSADDFVLGMIDKNELAVKDALHTQVNRLKRPPQSVAEVLATLKKCGLKKSVRGMSRKSMR